MSRARSVVTLRSQTGSALQDERVREMVIANVHAIAERNGVHVVEVRADDESVSIEIEGDRLAAVGLAAELRRATESWYTHKFGASLWGSGSEQTEGGDAL